MVHGRRRKGRPSLLFFPVGDATLGSTRTQCYERAADLRALGYRADVLLGWERKGFWGGKLRHALFPFCFLGYDIVVFGKTLNALAAAEARLAKAAGKTVVFLTDDWFEDAQERLARMFRLAHASGVGTAFTEGKVRAAGGKPFRLFALADTEKFAPARRGQGLRAGPAHANTVLRIGWVGSSLWENLLLIAGPLGALAKQVRFEMRIIGPRNERVITALEKAGVRVSAPGWMEPADVPGEVARFDIAVMPAADDSLHQAAMPTKLLEYLAAGVPTVASPVGGIKDVVGGRNGIIARTPVEWERALLRLARSKAERARFGRAGRRTIVERFSLRATSKQFLRAVLAAHEQRKR